MSPARFAINVEVTGLTAREVDDLRDTLATIVEQALGLLPGESAVGTTTVAPSR